MSSIATAPAGSIPWDSEGPCPEHPCGIATAPAGSIPQGRSVRSPAVTRSTRGRHDMSPVHKGTFICRGDLSSRPHPKKASRRGDLSDRPPLPAALGGDMICRPYTKVRSSAGATSHVARVYKKHPAGAICRIARAVGTLQVGDMICRPYTKVRSSVGATNQVARIQKKASRRGDLADRPPLPAALAGDMICRPYTKVRSSAGATYQVARIQKKHPAGAI